MTGGRISSPSVFSTNIRWFDVFLYCITQLILSAIYNTFEHYRILTLSIRRNEKKIRFPLRWTFLFAVSTAATKASWIHYSYTNFMYFPYQWKPGLSMDVPKGPGKSEDSIASYELALVSSSALKQLITDDAENLSFFKSLHKAIFTNGTIPTHSLHFISRTVIIAAQCWSNNAKQASSVFTLLAVWLFNFDGSI